LASCDPLPFGLDGALRAEGQVEPVALLASRRNDSYHSQGVFRLSIKVKRQRSHAAALRRLAGETLHANDPQDLARLLTQALPATLQLDGAALLLWDRKVETFEGLSLGEGGVHPLGPEGGGVRAPEARYLLADGHVVETPGTGEGTLVPLMARSGLVGMLVLGPQRHRRKLPFRPAEARLLSVIANHAALALENQLYQRELIASERVAALGTMAGMLAHDFRGPMTVIRGYAETLLEDGLPAGEVRERARLIVASVDRLERMTGETLDFVRDSSRLVRRTVPINTMLQELAAGLAAELPGLQVTSEFDVPLGACAAFDVDKLRRALSNIAANAWDAMGGRGRLRLEARLEEAPPGKVPGGPWLALLVADEGPGVADAIRDKLFQPFATFGKKKGTGLGLAVSRRFVEDHGGILELLPNAPPPGQGARFRIVLPVARPAPSAGPL
jgi:signal transduction histidine kinase